MNSAEAQALNAARAASGYLKQIAEDLRWFRLREEQRATAATEVAAPPAAARRSRPKPSA